MRLNKISLPKLFRVAWVVLHRQPRPVERLYFFISFNILLLFLFLFLPLLFLYPRGRSPRQTTPTPTTHKQVLVKPGELQQLMTATTSDNASTNTSQYKGNSQSETKKEEVSERTLVAVGGKYEQEQTRPIHPRECIRQTWETNVREGAFPSVVTRWVCLIDWTWDYCESVSFYLLYH